MDFMSTSHAPGGENRMLTLFLNMRMFSTKKQTKPKKIVLKQSILSKRWLIRNLMAFCFLFLIIYVGIFL